MQLGRRLQEAAAFDSERLDVKLGNDLVSEERRFDFDEVAVVKELSQTGGASRFVWPARRAMRSADEVRAVRLGVRHDCECANVCDETCWPGRSGGMGQSSMSQTARSSSPLRLALLHRHRCRRRTRRQAAGDVWRRRARVVRATVAAWRAGIDRPGETRAIRPRVRCAPASNANRSSHWLARASVDSKTEHGWPSFCRP